MTTMRDHVLGYRLYYRTLTSLSCLCPSEQSKINELSEKCVTSLAAALHYFVGKNIDRYATSIVNHVDNFARTKETLAGGQFMSVINVLMQLRKVCNHPNLFEPRPTVSPFVTAPLVLRIPSIVHEVLERHPFEVIASIALFKERLYITL